MVLLDLHMQPITKLRVIHDGYHMFLHTRNTTLRVGFILAKRERVIELDPRDCDKTSKKVETKGNVKTLFAKMLHFKPQSYYSYFANYGLSNAFAPLRYAH